MLEPDSWVPLALRLDLLSGRSTRVDHDCGPGRTLLLSREGDRLSAHCFRCNDSAGHRLEVPLAERIARLAEQQVADNQATATQALPRGLLPYAEWPGPARLWFAKAGLHAEDAGKLSAGYDPVTRRVVLPVGPGYWQARAVWPGQTPKYIAPVAKKVFPRYGAGPVLVLVEDLLSAYKVGRITAAWSMLGTSLPQELLSDILREDRKVAVWLDDDPGPINRGQVAAAKVLRTLRGLGVDARNLVTPKDPKLLPYHEIERLLL